MGEPVIRRTTLAERCDTDRLTMDDISQTWAMGACCLGCGRPVSISISHYPPRVTEATAPSRAPSEPLPHTSVLTDANSTFTCIEHRHDECRGQTAGDSPCSCACHRQAPSEETT